MKDNFTSRAIRVINIAIAMIVIAALALTYWFAYRPLPQRSGSITAPVSASAAVAFDARGVPHIRAASQEDAFFIQGYVTAQDRLWQMDALRRYDAGELSEVLGPKLLDTDRESRRLRLRRVAEAAYLTLPAGDRAVFAAYARGVNEFIATHLHNLPVEFTLLGYQPRPWSVVDSLLVCIHMFRDLSTTWRDEIVKRDMMAQGNPEKVKTLFPIRTGVEPLPGSNAWAIAGAHTASGKPLLSNDPHLQYSLPGIWYMTHLTAPGLDVSGVTVPGLPGVIIGHNQRIAWGITNLGFDVQDLCLENFDERTGRYEFHGRPQQAALEHEIIRAKGRPAVDYPVWVTKQGPVFVSEGKDRMVLRWSLYEPGLVQYPILDIDRAHNWQQFTAALARFPGPGSNFVYADADGNIGYHAAGKLPIRRGYTGDLPVDVSTGDAGWDGYIPFDQLPSAFNPPDGVIVTANQNPFPKDYPYPVNGSFAPPLRARQIRALLCARNGWRAQDLLTVQKDVYSEADHFLARQVAAAYDRGKGHTPELDSAAALLRGWNGQMEKDLGAPLLITLVYQHVRSAFGESAAPGKGAAYRFQMAPGVLEKLLRERPPGWFKDYDDMLRKAFADGVNEASRIQGRNPAHWNWGMYMRVGVNHPILHEVPGVGKYFDVAPVPMSGSDATVRRSTRTMAPSMRMNADAGDWDRSLMNILAGQSGQILSGHYRDEWTDNYYVRSYPMEFRSVGAKSTLEFRPSRLLTRAAR
jgi:penicillin amidase